MEAKSKRYLVGTLFVLLVMLSSSTTVQAIHGSQISTLFSERFEWIFPQNDDTRITGLGTDFNDTKEQLRAIIAFMKDNYNKKSYELAMKNLGYLQAKYLKSGTPSMGSLTFDLDSFMSILELQDDDVKEQAKEEIEEIYLATLGGSRNNTQDFYNFRSLYILGNVITRDINFWNWTKVAQPLLFVINCILVYIIFTFFKVGALEPAMSFFLTSFVTFGIWSIILARYAIAWVLSTSSIDMVLHFVNATGVHLTGLLVTATPWDRDIMGPFGSRVWRDFPEWEFKGVEPSYSSCDGLYLIPGDHVGDVDVPPGIYNFRVTGCANDGNYYDTSFDNSEDPVPSYGRYAHFRTLQPVSPP